MRAAILSAAIALASVSATVAGGYARWNNTWGRWDVYDGNGNSAGYSQWNNTWNRWDTYNGNGNSTGHWQWNPTWGRWDFND
jgi:hypothetical protein